MASKKFMKNITMLNISNESIKSAIELSSKYINDRFLPDKAIDLIDETGALC